MSELKQSPLDPHQAPVKAGDAERLCNAQKHVRPEPDRIAEIVAHVPIPLCHLEASRRLARFFVRVPLNECEKLPDPDYGF